MLNVEPLIFVCSTFTLLAAPLHDIIYKSKYNEKNQIELNIALINQ